MAAGQPHTRGRCTTTSPASATPSPASPTTSSTATTPAWRSTRASCPTRWRSSVVYDAFTEPRLYRLYCDNAAAPPGINRFDLHPYYGKDGRSEDYRSDRKGPGKRPRPIGSRMGPQNMVMCGVALQLLAEQKGLWEKRYSREFAKDVRVPIDRAEQRGKNVEARGSPKR